MSNGQNETDGPENGRSQTTINGISGVTVAVGPHAQAIGTLIKQIEETNIAGDFVAHQEISNTILIVGSEGLDQLTAWLAAQQGLTAQVLQRPGARMPSQEVDRQIAEVLAAQRETAAQGLPTSPEASYHLGMLAAFRRDYEAAITYFQEAGDADPGFSAAFEGTAWLQQSLAAALQQKQDYGGALDRLAQARTAAERSDPLSTQALALRGYIAKSLAQIAEVQDDPAGSRKYYAEAERMFAHIVKLEPDNAAAHNGLANVQFAAGQLDAAIASAQRAIELLPNYTAAYHDLALAYEAKWRNQPVEWEKNCVKALAAWREAYHLAPDDPAFTADQLLEIGRRIRELEKYCG